MLGTAAVAMWWDVAPEVQAEWEDWHSHEHMPERLSIPGFLRGTRWIAPSGEPSYFVLYEAESMRVLTEGPYVERLNDPTPWSRRMMPEHRNMVRSLCDVRARFGAGVAHAVATLRLEAALPAERLAALPLQRGVTSALLLEARPMAGPPTVEQKIRGGDGEAKWVAVVGGYDADAVAGAAAALGAGIPGVYRLSYCLP